MSEYFDLPSDDLHVGGELPKSLLPALLEALAKDRAVWVETGEPLTVDDVLQIDPGPLHVAVEDPTDDPFSHTRAFCQQYGLSYRLERNADGEIVRWLPSLRDPVVARIDGEGNILVTLEQLRAAVETDDGPRKLVERLQGALAPVPPFILLDGT